MPPLPFNNPFPVKDWWSPHYTGCLNAPCPILGYLWAVSEPWCISSGCWQALLAHMLWLTSWTWTGWVYLHLHWCLHSVHGHIWVGAHVWMGVCDHVCACVQVVFVVTLVAVVDVGFMVVVIMWGVVPQGWATSRAWWWWRKSGWWCVTSHLSETEILNKKQDEKTNETWKVSEKHLRCFLVSSRFWVLFLSCFWCCFSNEKQNEKQAKKCYCELP